MYRADAGFILRDSRFSLVNIDGSSEIYEMSGYNLQAEVYTDYGRTRKAVSVVKIFHKDSPQIFSISSNVQDLMCDLNSHPIFISIR